MSNSSWFETTNLYIKYRIEVTINSQNLVDNLSNVTVKVWAYSTDTSYAARGSGACYFKISDRTYSASITSAQQITNSGIYLFSKTLNVQHDSDGTKELTCSSWITHAQFTSSEQSFTTQLPRIGKINTITSVNGGTIGDSMTVNISKMTSTYTSSVFIKLGNSDWLKMADKATATSISFTLPIELANQIPNSTSGTGTVRVRTYNGDEEIGYVDKDVTFTVPSYTPEVDMFLLSEFGTKSGIYIKGKSKINYNGSATSLYGATIISYLWNFDDKMTSSSASGTTPIWGYSGDCTITLTVKDSRGITASKNTTITFLTYSPPVAKISAYRCNSSGIADNNGTYVKVTFTGTASLFDIDNTISIEINKKLSTETSWTNTNRYTTVQNETSVILSDFSTDYIYNIQISVTDSITNTTNEITVPASFVLMDFKAGGTGIAIGKVADKDDALDIDLTTYFKKIRQEYCQTATSGSTYGDSNYMTKIGRINVSDGPHSLCAGILRFIPLESYLGLSGELVYYFRTNDTISSCDILLEWKSLDDSYYTDSIKCVKVSNGVFDLYFEPKDTEVTERIVKLEGNNEEKLTLYTNQDYVSSSSLTPYLTSTMMNYPSKNEPGQWWNEGVVNVQDDGITHLGKYINLHSSNENTTYSDAQIYTNGGYIYINKSILASGVGIVNIGASDNRWNTIYLVRSPDVSSDRTLKENIQYLRNNNVSKDDTMTYSDMYNFVRDDLELAKYNFKGQDTEEINFIAQDLLYNVDGTDNKIGQFIVNPVAPNTEEEILEIKNNLEEGQEYHDPTLSYDIGNYVSVLAGALKSAINEIEMLKQEVTLLKQIIDINKY